MMRALFVALLRAYKGVVSPFLPPACRFYPSCSEYAAQAVEQHGVLRGSTMSAKRIARCHPWHPGGFDPVPIPVLQATSGSRRVEQALRRKAPARPLRAEPAGHPER